MTVTHASESGYTEHPLNSALHPVTRSDVSAMPTWRRAHHREESWFSR